MSEPKKIFILLGDPNNESLCAALADEYEEAARSAGFEIRRTNLADVSFDPILHKGYRVIQELEPGLTKIQQDMAWSNHIVLLHPIWWASMPSLLKGMFDRIWIPGFAFHFKKTGSGWLKFLSGRSCRIIQTSGTSKFLIMRKFGSPSVVLRKGILGFAGIGPIKVTWFGNVNCAPVEKVAKMKGVVRKLGLKGK